MLNLKKKKKKNLKFEIGKNGGAIFIWFTWIKILFKS